MRNELMSHAAQPSPATDALIPLPRLPVALANLTGQLPPTYRSVYLSVLDGVVPTVIVRGRHFVSSSDLESIAQKFGMAVPVPARPTRRPRLNRAAA